MTISYPYRPEPHFKTPYTPTPPRCAPANRECSRLVSRPGAEVAIWAPPSLVPSSSGPASVCKSQGCVKRWCGSTKHPFEFWHLRFDLWRKQGT
jgi:hypothetical protein